MAGLPLACASKGPKPHPDLVSVWKRYLDLPALRALAIAGHPGRDRWVSAAAGGHATLAEAEDGAMRECRKRRQLRRIQAACVTYAIGDEIVWVR